MAEYPDTYGWDTVFAISIEEVNKVLAKRAPSQTYSGQTNLGNDKADGHWSLAGWKITDTPGGAEIVIEMRFGSGSQLKITKGGVDSIYDLALPQYLCTVTFDAWFDGGGLVPRTGQDRRWAAVAIGVPDGTPFEVKLALTTLLSNWFATPGAVALFEEEFIGFNMSAEVGKDELPWLIPKQPLGFAGGIMADGVTKAIGILAMTIDGKTPSIGELKLSPYAIPANASAGFVISRQLVMTNMILPAAAGAFSVAGDGDPANVDLDSQSWQLSNKAALAFKHDLAGTSQDCTIDPGNLKMWQEADRLHLSITPLTMTTDIAGLFVDAKIDERLEMLLLPKTGDPTAMVFMLNNVDPQAPVTSHHWSTNSEIIISVIGAVLTAAGVALSVVGFRGPLQRCGLTPTMAKIWSRVIAGIVGTGIVAITALAAQAIVWARDGNAEEIPDIGPLVRTALGRIKWPGETKTTFVATAGHFANGVHLTIAPRFT